jgi:DNA-binding response OmpR family regulator
MLDMVMPKVSGAELYKRLDSKGGQTGFYILSGGAPEIDSMKGDSFLGYIPKPVRLEEIDEKIKSGAQKVIAGL